MATGFEPKAAANFRSKPFFLSSVAIAYCVGSARCLVSCWIYLPIVWCIELKADPHACKALMDEVGKVRASASTPAVQLFCRDPSVLPSVFLVVQVDPTHGGTL